MCQRELGAGTLYCPRDAVVKDLINTLNGDNRTRESLTRRLDT